MTRAILLAGWSTAPQGPGLREYAVLPLARPPFGRPFLTWQRLAAGLDVELAASWLVVREGAGQVPDGVRGGFRGCLSGVTEEGAWSVLKRLDAAASRSRVLTDFGSIRNR